MFLVAIWLYLIVNIIAQIRWKHFEYRNVSVI